MRTLQGRVAVVTGAGSGIGRATSVMLAQHGCRLALVDVNDRGMAETADLVRGAGRPVSVHRADVSNRTEMQALPERVIAEHDHVHIVVNNAGVGLTGTVEETALADLDWIVGINFWGVVHGCKFFLPHLLREDEGHIVNLSSMLGFMGVPGQSGYCATKFAVHGFTAALAAELSATRIGVTCVHPGTIRTNILQASRFTDEEQKRRIAARIDRFAIPAERVARLIVRAIERNTFRVVVGTDAQAVHWLARLLPLLSLRAVSWAYQRYGTRG
jgi:NAD(P)-dependent dehydrogenase (short-subunit alcohol dehydrogenase family)